MTTKPNPITLPCVCHVPPPEGTVRIEIRKPKEGERYWSDTLQTWNQAIEDFKFQLVPVAIIPRWRELTPVEACRLLAEAGGPIEVECSDDGKSWPKRVLCAVDIRPSVAGKFGDDCDVSWRKIRVRE